MSHLEWYSFGIITQTKATKNNKHYLNSFILTYSVTCQGVSKVNTDSIYDSIHQEWSIYDIHGEENHEN